MSPAIRNLRPLALLTMLALALGLAMAGCGSDDDDSSPNNPGGTQEFDEAFAVQQSQFMVVSIVQQMTNLGFYADGITTKADDIYTWAWVDDPGRWEGSYSGSYEGFTSTFDVWLQYLDALGEPQQGPLGAAAMSYHIESALTGSESGDGYSYSLAFDYLQNFAATGLGTSTLLIDGDGTTGIDYSYSSDGSSGSASYDVSWEVLGAGISYPLDGCPTGSMEITMAPFTVTVVFDGSDTATFTMRNGVTVIPDGSGTIALDCATPGL
ncbi:MAG: hypothetical protein R3D98_11885 [Candidatus Krumholzibacteriia bacterium]